MPHRIGHITPEQRRNLFGRGRQALDFLGRPGQMAGDAMLRGFRNPISPYGSPGSNPFSQISPWMRQLLDPMSQFLNPGSARFLNPVMRGLATQSGMIPNPVINRNPMEAFGFLPTSPALDPFNMQTPTQTPTQTPIPTPTTMIDRNFLPQGTNFTGIPEHHWMHGLQRRNINRPSMPMGHITQKGQFDPAITDRPYEDYYDVRGFNPVEPQTPPPTPFEGLTPSPILSPVRADARELFDDPSRELERTVGQRRAGYTNWPVASSKVPNWNSKTRTVLPPNWNRMQRPPEDLDQIYTDWQLGGD